MKDEGKIKMAIIAGASSALKYKEKNPRASDQEIIRHVNQEASSIVLTINSNQFQCLLNLALEPNQCAF